MGLKGYRLLAMGQLDSNVQSPTSRRSRRARSFSSHAVAVQVDPFEKQTLTPFFSLDRCKG
jgi:hypothetical protein